MNIQNTFTVPNRETTYEVELDGANIRVYIVSDVVDLGWWDLNEVEEDIQRAALIALGDAVKMLLAPAAWEPTDGAEGWVMAPMVTVGMIIRIDGEQFEVNSIEAPSPQNPSCGYVFTDPNDEEYSAHASQWFTYSS